ncbi:PP16B inhibitor, partial [Amia calva]|nr:PP16B inhibitor [Amia calva]
MQSKKRKADKRRPPASALPAAAKRHVSFTASVALLEASARNDPDEVRYLLKNNVSPDLCNEDGLTALHQVRVSVSPRVPPCLEVACLSLCGCGLWTPLHAAATCGHTQLVKILIHHGADLLAVNSDGNMPYDLCEDDATLEVIETAMANRGITQEMINETRAALEQRMIGDIQGLLQENQDLNQPDSQGATLLHIAAANGYVQAAELLLEGGARLDRRDTDGWQPLHAAACWGQMHVAELLVSHGASLIAKTHMDETPIELCEDEEFKAMLRDLKQKHDIIMKSQLKQKTSLCRRTSSAGSRGKVVRRASLSDRNNLYRKEYETEAIVWLGGQKEEERERDSNNNDKSNSNESNDSNDIASECDVRETQLTVLHVSSSAQNHSLAKPRPRTLKDGVSWNSSVSTGTATPSHPPCNGEPPQLGASDAEARLATPAPVTTATSQPGAEPWTAGRERCAQTLSELKRQRAAAKLLSHPLLNGHLSNGSAATSPPGDPADGRMPLVSSNGSAVYYTPASGDPPLLRLKQPLEEAEEKSQGCCTIS